MEVKTIQEIKDYILKSDEKTVVIMGTTPLCFHINGESQEFDISKELLTELMQHKDFNIEYENMHMFITLK